MFSLQHKAVSILVTLVGDKNVVMYSEVFMFALVWQYPVISLVFAILFVDLIFVLIFTFFH